MSELWLLWAFLGFCVGVGFMGLTERIRRAKANAVRNQGAKRRNE